MARKNRTKIPLLALITLGILVVTLPFFVLSSRTKQDTRQQAASSCPTSFADVSSSSLTSKLACMNTQGTGCIVNGEQDGLFYPTRALSRAEFYAFITRFHVYILKDWDFYTPSTPTFPDVPPSHSFYKEIETAHYYNWARGNGSNFQGAPTDQWLYDFHGVYREGSTDKYGTVHAGDCWNGCYNFASLSSAISRETMVTDLFTYGTTANLMSSCPAPTNTPIPPTNTPMPTNTPVPPTATPKPTNTPFPTNTPIPPTPTSLPRPTNIPMPTLATSPTPGCVQTDIGCLPDNPVKFAEKVYGIGMGILGGLALLAIMYGGYQIATSAGNAAQVESGKKYIYYALGALGLGIFGLVLFEMISTNTFHIPGFS